MIGQGEFMPIDLQTIDERLAKAKEEADFWEKARAVLADPRLAALSGSQTPAFSPTWQRATTMPRAYGEIQDKVISVLPGPDAGIAERLTTQQIVAILLAQGYVFVAKEPAIAVNGALVTLQEKGLAEWSQKRGKAKLWRKKRAKIQETRKDSESQEAPEGAS